MFKLIIYQCGTLEILILALYPMEICPCIFTYMYPQFHRWSILPYGAFPLQANGICPYSSALFISVFIRQHYSRDFGTYGDNLSEAFLTLFHFRNTK